MGNRSSIQDIQDIPVATAVITDVPIVTAYAVEETIPSAPLMPDDFKFIIPSAPPMQETDYIRECQLRNKFIEDKNKLFGKKRIVPSTTPEILPFGDKYKNYSDSISVLEGKTIKQTYFEDPYETWLREGIDRCNHSMVRDLVKLCNLDRIEILTRQLDYVNKIIAMRKSNKIRFRIKAVIEERIQVLLG
jgi:hypothetical protein